MVLHVATPYGRQGPSSRVRVYEWLDRARPRAMVSGYIAAHNASPGVVARHPLAVLRAEGRLRRMAAARPERMLVHREASPLSRGGLETRLLARAEFAVYDFDDALQWDWGEGGALRRLAPKARKALIGARRADRVIAGSPVLADWASQHNADVVLIPSCVAPGRYRTKTDYGLAAPPRLGWIGSAGNEPYLRLIARPLRELHRRTGARLTLIGTTRPTLGELEPMIDRVAWSEAVQHTELAGIDVALMPVPDEPYERGKCGYKLLQYGAAGVPTVGSPVGVNRDILARFGMPAAETDDEWVDGVLGLLSASPPERAALGARARQITKAEYSYDAWLERWRQAVGLA